jgi:hypothetical protein
VQLDKTTIAIRERGVLDTLDLSLHVLRVYGGSLAVAMALGVFPLMVINHLLLGWMAEAVDEEVAIPFRFVWHTSVLVFLEAPLASIFATAYLGEAVFLERPRLREIVVKVGKMFPRVVWCQILLRGVGLAWLVLLTMDHYGDFDIPVEGLVPGALVLYAAGLRAFRPFMNEIVLLERNPLRAAHKDEMTIGKRSKMLHSPSYGDLFVRWVSSAAIALALNGSVYGTMRVIAGVFFQDWDESPFTVQLCLPLSMWMVAWFFTVFRFMSYLDTRIRQEGWEVELRLRAEAIRIANRIS